MIWESHWWKDSLLKSRDYLSRVRISKRTSERTFVRIEKEIFFGFYSVRKLLDTFKVSSHVNQIQFDLVAYNAIRAVDYLNWHHLHKNYNLAIRKLETRDIRFLCNQFIHSYVFVISDVGSRINGFFVASDRVRNNKCYFVELGQVLSTFRMIGKDYPAEMQLQRDESGQWIGQIG